MSSFSLRNSGQGQELTNKKLVSRPGIKSSEKREGGLTEGGLSSFCEAAFCFLGNL